MSNTKQFKIFDLYSQLGKNGERGRAIEFISELTGVRKSTIKSNWFNVNELPFYLLQDEKKLNKIIQYLENQL